MKPIVSLSDKEFLELKNIIYKESGIQVKEDQRENLEFKLASRLIEYNLKSFKEYHNLLVKNKAEIQTMINAVTTNETYFFRELRHFKFLKNEILPTVKYDLFRCWSAAGSNGAEAYSIAMEIDSNLSNYKNYEVVISDINDNVLKYAKRGIYPLKFAKKIPEEYLKSYCLKGKNEFSGSFKISDKIKNNIVYKHINLTDHINPQLGMFDVIFLRNMIIYFDDKEKKLIVENVIKHLKDGGYLFMGHSESLHRITDKVFQVSPSIYQKGVKNKEIKKMPKSSFNKVSAKVVAIGSSMGGLSIIEDTLLALQENTPPILIVQHMSRDILPSLISKLSQKCKVKIKEAQNDEIIEQGRVYFAPFNKHLSIKNISHGIYKTILTDGNKVANHKPSIDILFNSLANEVKRHSIAFILSGMGNDGVEGIKNIKLSGGLTYAQDEESCEVFGMAKLAIDNGSISKVITPDKISMNILL
jgi:chemotaxis protein methyltransferase CheR